MSTTTAGTFSVPTRAEVSDNNQGIFDTLAKSAEIDHLHPF